MSDFECFGLLYLVVNLEDGKRCLEEEEWEGGSL